MDEQSGWQAVTLDLRRDLFRRRLSSPRCPAGGPVCGRLLKMHVVEGLPWKQAGAGRPGRFRAGRAAMANTPATCRDTKGPTQRTWWRFRRTTRRRSPSKTARSLMADQLSVSQLRAMRATGLRRRPSGTGSGRLLSLIPHSGQKIQCLEVRGSGVDRDCGDAGHGGGPWSRPVGRRCRCWS